MDYRLFRIYLFAIVSLVSSSCTTDEDTLVTYNPGITISAAHLFDGFTPLYANDFNPAKGNWSVEVDVMVYDAGGTLVDHDCQRSPDIQTRFVYDNKLGAGDYTMVCVASFVNDVDDYRYWEIRDKERLSSLSIDEVDEIEPTPFETLGVSVVPLVTDGKDVFMDIEIKPVTALCSFFLNLRDEGAWGDINDWYYLAMHARYYQIFANEYRNSVSLEGGKIAYKKKNADKKQVVTSAYPYMVCSMSNPECLSMVYRAFLPVNSQSYSWEITKRSDWPDDIPVSGESERIDLATGDQYVINMLLCCTDILVDRFDPSYSYDESTYKYVWAKDLERLRYTLSIDYPSLLGKDDWEIIDYLGTVNYGHDYGWEIDGEYYWYTDHFYINSQFAADTLYAFFLSRDCDHCDILRLNFYECEKPVIDAMLEILKQQYTFVNTEDGIHYFCEKGATPGNEKYKISFDEGTHEYIETYFPKLEFRFSNNE